MKTPDPEQLRPLLEAGLAIMSPHDPAREGLQADVTIFAGLKDPQFTLFYSTPVTSLHACGRTPDEAVEKFRAKYKGPKTNSQRAAELRAEADKLEAAQ